jgi:hypothetical protein
MGRPQWSETQVATVSEKVQRASDGTYTKGSSTTWVWYLFSAISQHVNKLVALQYLSLPLEGCCCGLTGRNAPWAFSLAVVYELLRLFYILKVAIILSCATAIAHAGSVSDFRADLHSFRVVG